MVVLDSHGQILAIGEAKARLVTPTDRSRLERVRSLLGSSRPVRLLLASATGFAPGLEADDIELIDVNRLYHGS